MTRLETLRRLKSGARTYASKFEAAGESGTGVRMRDPSGREVTDRLACAGALPLNHQHPQIRAALLPTPAKLHLTFPDTRGCWKISPSPD